MGTCWRQIKPQKAMWQHKDEFYWIKEQSGHVWVVNKHVQKGKCALLERGDASTCELIHDLICGSLLSTSSPHVSTRGNLWDKWQTHLNTWHALPLQVVRPSCPLGAPSFIGISLLCYIFKLSPLEN